MDILYNVGTVTSYEWGEIITSRSRVKFHPSETHLFQAIYRGYPFHSIYNCLGQSHLLAIIPLGPSHQYARHRPSEPNRPGDFSGNIATIEV